jgi:hypothetical protein
MSDFYAMSAMMKELFPSNPEADKKALMSMAGKTAPVETPVVVQESVDVPQGSLQIDKDYSVGDFAALAGIKLNETQKTGSAGQAKAKDPTPKMSKPSNKGEQPHPLKDKLVGEHNIPHLKNNTTMYEIGNTLEEVGRQLGLKGSYLRMWKSFAFDAFGKLATKQWEEGKMNSFKTERSLTGGEETEKERIVKGMKKNKSDFKDRYGDDAEAVMYATATKNAKKNESIKDQLLKMLEEKKQK